MTIRMVNRIRIKIQKTVVRKNNQNIIYKISSVQIFINEKYVQRH